MNKNPFADLTSGNMSKYKERNDEAIRLERAEALDERITSLNSENKDINWASKVFDFCEEEESLNSDIFDIATKAPMLEQMKKEALFIKEKYEKEQLEKMKKAEQELKEQALRIDAFITDLEKAEKSIYWCDDVMSADKDVQTMPAKARSKCTKLNTLTKLKKIAEDIILADKIDKKIENLKSNESNVESWYLNVVAFELEIKENAVPYMKEKQTYEEMLALSKEKLNEIRAERARLEKELADKKAKEKAERERKAAEAKAAKEAKERAEREERERIERERKEEEERIRREEEERKIRRKQEEERIRLKAMHKRKAKRQAFFWIVFIAFVVAVMAHFAIYQEVDGFVVGGIISIVYLFIWGMTVILKGKSLSDDSDYYYCGKYIYTPHSAICIIFGIASIPLVCISENTRYFTLLISLAMILCSIMLLRMGAKYAAFLYISGDIRCQTIFALIAFSCLYFSGEARFYIIGVGIFLVNLLFAFIVPKHCNSDDTSGYAVEFFLFLAVGIGFFITGFFVHGFAVLSLCMFLSSASCVVAMREESKETIFTIVIPLIGAGLSLIPLLR